MKNKTSSNGVEINSLEKEAFEHIASILGRNYSSLKRTFRYDYERHSYVKISDVRKMSNKIGDPIVICVDSCDVMYDGPDLIVGEAVKIQTGGRPYPAGYVTDISNIENLWEVTIHPNIPDTEGFKKIKSGDTIVVSRTKDALRNCTGIQSPFNKEKYIHIVFTVIFEKGEPKIILPRLYNEDCVNARKSLTPKESIKELDGIGVDGIGFEEIYIDAKQERILTNILNR